METTTADRRFPIDLRLPDTPGDVGAQVEAVMTERRYERARTGWTLLLAALAAGCATTASSTASRPVEEVHMDPLVVNQTTDPLTGLDGYDAAQLLDLGNRLYQEGDHDRAAKVFERLISAFPDSPLVPSALYDAGLAYEQLEAWSAALERYRRVVAQYPTAGTFRDAMFRSSLCYGKLERWGDVVDNYWAIRQLPKLTTMDELDARVGQGVGLFMQNDLATAEREFIGALRFHETHAKEEFLPAEYFVGQARFYLGEIAARQFEAIDLAVPPPEPPVGRDQARLAQASARRRGQAPAADPVKVWQDRLAGQLEAKCELLLRAQNEFIRAIRVGHSGWATASGYRIGSLYERLYDDMMQVPAPPGLSDETREFYAGELRKRVGVLVTKAIQVYEQSLEMATRVGEKNEWVERTSKSLERMKSLYLDAAKNG